MYIYFGKSNINKEEFDKHKMCHTRKKKKKQLGCQTNSSRKYLADLQGKGQLHKHLTNFSSMEFVCTLDNKF